MYEYNVGQFVNHPYVLTVGNAFMRSAVFAGGLCGTDKSVPYGEGFTR